MLGTQRALRGAEKDTRGLSVSARPLLLQVSPALYGFNDLSKRETCEGEAGQVASVGKLSWGPGTGRNLPHGPADLRSQAEGCQILADADKAGEELQGKAA